MIWGEVIIPRSEQKRFRLPAIDRICREGLTFDNFYANSCVCSPTRVALLTGYVPDRVGVPGVIATRNQSSATRQPFFLYLAYNAPHDLIQPPAEWIERVSKRQPGLSDKRVKLVARIEQMDAGIGKVLNKREELQLAGNTLVIFTSDHGGILGHGAVNGPWRSEKQHMYEGGLRVPAMARWPQRIAPGGHVAVTMDLFASVVEAAEITPPTGIDEVSVLPTLLGQPQSDQPRDRYFVRREGGPA